MNGKIYIRRDRIQFEMLPFPDDGNSYVRQAAHAWECAAISFIEAAGYEADVEAGYGKDHTKFRVWVQPTWTDDGGEMIPMTTQEETATKRTAYDADASGRDAAIEFAEKEAQFANPD